MYFATSRDVKSVKTHTQIDVYIEREERREREREERGERDRKTRIITYSMLSTSGSVTMLLILTSCKLILFVCLSVCLY